MEINTLLSVGNRTLIVAANDAAGPFPLTPRKGSRGETPAALLVKLLSLLKRKVLQQRFSFAVTFGGAGAIAPR